MKAEPVAEHAWLQQLLGDWVVESEMNAGEATQLANGTETVRSLGDLWVVAEGEGDLGGEIGKWLMTVGYDPVKGRFVGTWTGSMMANMFVYEGQLDPSGKILTLGTKGPDMKGEGSDTRYQDIIEIVGPDRRTMTSRLLGEDGEWLEFMRTTYERRS